MESEKPGTENAIEAVQEPDINLEANPPLEHDVKSVNDDQNTLILWLLVITAVVVGGSIWLLWHYWWPIVIFTIAIIIGISGLFSKDNKGFPVVLAIVGMVYGFDSCNEVRDRLKYEAQSRNYETQSNATDDDVFDKIGSWIRRQIDDLGQNDAQRDPVTSQNDIFSLTISINNPSGRTTIKSNSNVLYRGGYMNYDLPQGTYNIGCGVYSGNQSYSTADGDIDSRTYRENEINLNHSQTFSCDAQYLKQIIGEIDTQNKIMYFFLEDVIATLSESQIIATNSGYNFYLCNHNWSVNPDRASIEISNDSNEQVFFQNLEENDIKNSIPMQTLNEVSCVYTYSMEKNILNLPMSGKTIEIVPHVM